MIDTDKYEGHTPSGEGHYKWIMLRPSVGDPPSQREKSRNGIEGCYINMYLTDERWDEEELTEALANQALIADAPLLLAEVKELREWKNRVITYLGNEEMYDFYDWMKEKYGEEE